MRHREWRSQGSEKKNQSINEKHQSEGPWEPVSSLKGPKDGLFHDWNLERSEVGWGRVSRNFHTLIKVCSIWKSNFEYERKFQVAPYRLIPFPFVLESVGERNRFCCSSLCTSSRPWTKTSTACPGHSMVSGPLSPRACCSFASVHSVNRSHVDTAQCSLDFVAVSSSPFPPGRVVLKNSV